MDLYSLIHRNGQIQISLVHFLLEKNAPTTVSEITDNLGISPFLFENNIEELMALLPELKLGLTISYHKKSEVVTLHKSQQTDLTKLNYYYLQHSLDYQLLVYLYYHPTFSITKLCQHLALGEAAVYRRINKLNGLMAEFEITIKRGQIMGNELQICYFFFRLFWNALPLGEIEARSNNQNSLQFVMYLEKQLKQTLSNTAKVKLYLWIRILKTRVAVQDKNSQQTEPIIANFLAQQQQDPLYQVIREAYFLSMSNSALYGSEYKAIYLYFFISSVFVLDPDNPFLTAAGYWPTYNDKIKELNDLVVTKVKQTYHLSMEMIDPDFVREWRYILTQIHSIVFYFRGNIHFYDDDYMYQNLLKSNIQSPDFQLAQQIVEQIETTLGYPLKRGDKLLMNRIHLYFFKEMRGFSHQEIKIGVFYKQDYLQNHIMIQNIQGIFNAGYPITCEVAKKGTHYHLLISDSEVFSQQYQYEQLYIINDFTTTTDIAALVTLLKELLEKEGAQ